MTGTVGPTVARGDTVLPLRDWQSDALAPLAEQDRRRGDLVALAAKDLVETPFADPAAADVTLAAEVQQRVRRSGKTNVSSAVSDRVRAGLLRRHYAGWCEDHDNRGAQRQAVSTIEAQAIRALRTKTMLL